MSDSEKDNYKRPKWASPELIDWDTETPPVDRDELSASGDTGGNQVSHSETTLDTPYDNNDTAETTDDSSSADERLIGCFPTSTPCLPRPCPPRPCFPLPCPPRPCNPQVCLPRPCPPRPCFPLPCPPRPCNPQVCFPRPCPPRPCNPQMCFPRPCPPRPCPPNTCKPR